MSEAKGRSKTSKAEQLAQAATPDRLVFHERELQKVNAKADRFKALYNAAQAQLAERDKLEEAWFQVQERLKPIQVKPRHKASVDEAVAVTLWSDWHVEERVDPKTIDGINSYDLDICQARAKRLFQNLLRLITKERSHARIDQLVIALLGDFITGFIHDELIETNLLHPSEAQRYAKKLIISGIEFLLEHGDFKDLYVVCCYGNHGRTTKRMRVKTGAKNSWEWLMYLDIADYFNKEKRVHFQIAEGGIIYSEVLGTTVRWCHGNQVIYKGGVGGVYVPLNKAIHKWNETRFADITCLGHWHNLQYLPNAVVNGSLIGINEYGIEVVKAAAEPPMQALYLVAKEYGPVCFNKVFAEVGKR